MLSPCRSTGTHFMLDAANVTPPLYLLADAKVVSDIQRMGKMLPAESGKVGDGIYFALTEKDALVKADGTGYLITAQVSTGRRKDILCPGAQHKNYTFQRLHAEGYDSIYLPRGSGHGHPEWCVFNSNQVKIVSIQECSSGRKLRELAVPVLNGDTHMLDEIGHILGDANSSRRFQHLMTTQSGRGLCGLEGMLGNGTALGETLIACLTLGDGVLQAFDKLGGGYGRQIVMFLLVLGVCLTKALGAEQLVAFMLFKACQTVALLVVEVVAALLILMACFSTPSKADVAAGLVLVGSCLMVVQGAAEIGLVLVIFGACLATTLDTAVGIRAARVVASLLVI
eukprot:TRINITY_DN77003_c0_g1_i1.p1 TRINITY_DN77003_c0_g1~~TRINITY_DN77003_c0_g1_i1.p1  ORF type:complete len:340 (-),score=69.67 TRINITY_DN77003_c0_g1_i1:37-1056(-)